MTKHELREKLEAGEVLNELLPAIDGQDCLVYRASEWPKDEWSGDMIIYIPDYDLHYIEHLKPDLSADEIDDILDSCFTRDDFLKEAFYNERCAESLFWQCDWQSPNIQDLMDCTDDDEALESYGETWEEMKRRCGAED